MGKFLLGILLVFLGGCFIFPQKRDCTLDQDGDGVLATYNPEYPGVCDGDVIEGQEDCDDADPRNFPGNPEVCDGQDNNCDGFVDYNPIDGVTYYLDTDGDGFGYNGEPETVGCEQPAPDGSVQWTTDNTDCNDGDSAIYPGAPEVCNGIDDSCEGDIDEGLDQVWHPDGDGDGFGSMDSTAGVYQCSDPSTDPAASGLRYLTDGTDCNDTRADVYPGAPEVCDNVDNDCNNQIDEAQECAP